MLQRQKDNVRVYFDRVSGEYERAYDTAIVDSLKTYIFLRRREKVINILEKCGGRVLDIGCGPGVFTDKLIDKGYEEIWGVDNSEAMIESAKKRMVLTENSGKINFVVGDIEKLNFADNYFDCVVCAGVLEYFLIIFGLLGFWYLRIFGQVSHLVVIFISLSIVGASVYLIFHNRVDSFISSFFSSKSDGLIIRLEQFYAGFKDLARMEIILPVALTALSYLIYFFQCHLILLSFSIKVNFLVTIFLMSLINLVSLVPISISGIGTREAAMVYLFALNHIPKEEAIAFSFMIFTIFYVFGGFFGYGGWIIRNKISLAKVDNE